MCEARKDIAQTTVLVVNRRKDAVAFLRNHLEMAGFRVVTAKDGSTALDFARRESPALVLLDLVPPAGCSGGGEEIDGCEFLRRLRRESDVGVIVLSHWDDEASKLAAFEAGADDYLPRPYNPPELLARIRAVLRRVKGEIKALQ